MKWLFKPGHDGVSPILWILFWFFATFALVGFAMQPMALLMGW
ncbi:MAG TPA: hypothetical protein VHS28_03490 [Chloroflexota bacterium]|nr:hypothetical protein [Chloroflexota bacterium]